MKQALFFLVFLLFSLSCTTTVVIADNGGDDGSSRRTVASSSNTVSPPSIVPVLSVSDGVPVPSMNTNIHIPNIQPSPQPIFQRILRGGTVGGSRPSGGSSFSSSSGTKPSSGGFSSSSGTRPSSGGFSSSSGTRPSSGGFSSTSSGGSGTRPSSGSSPTFNSRPRPTPSTVISPTNPNPVYKPTTITGAPTTFNGGGGFSAKALTVAAVSGAAVTVAAGSFFYGGRYSSPSCRGSYRYTSPYCGSRSQGYASTNHICTGKIPICKIPESIREEWYVGDEVSINILADKTTCTTLGTVTASSSSTPASSSTASSTSTNTTTDTPPVVNTNFTLNDCLQEIVRSGTCDSNRFTYDEISMNCGCCSVGSSLIDWDYTSAVYSIFNKSIGDSSAPTHCINNATLYYPKKNADTSNEDGLLSNYVDAEVRCDFCGACSECGDIGVSYMDWSGPYTVNESLFYEEGVLSLDSSDYDPIETCICNEPLIGNNCDSYPGGESAVVVSPMDPYLSNTDSSGYMYYSSAATSITSRGKYYCGGTLFCIFFTFYLQVL